MSASDTASHSRHVDNRYVWRDLGVADLDDACRLSAALGWPHRREDWAQLLDVGQGIALVHDGRLIGTGLCIAQGALATIALIVIDEAYRGLGLGRQMMSRVMALAGDLPTMLVATNAGAPMYEKFGFVSRNPVAQYQGVAAAASTSRDPSVADMTMADRDAIERLADAGSGRGPVLATTLVSAEAVKVYRDDQGGVAGFAARRPFGKGEVIGPVVAHTRAQAAALVDALLAQANGRFVRMDILADGLAPEWLAERGLDCVARIIQMSRGELPIPDPGAPDTPRQFALTTQAFG
ncbi:GNAT family N-acetyltransferase [Salinisphaera sp. LB1]|uniref:GNAT family N-acetyltransferase n=1 Tax=unclassified Salinisphaera TaxID=2649847 RepID=UPI000D7E094E|nr:GNAT family N-acetyltransferase [Salinisphaera sp. LB1]AWN15050.1 Histone acetyltransferase HPA2 and related acetyltransferase [Salinisphaera sp. LB1]